MSSFLADFEYDIFISYRHNDNRSGWVTEFVEHLHEELASTIKEPLSIYFDKNPHDGLLETHNVDKSLEGKLKCLIFIPIISQTYCDPKSFAWEHEFITFNKYAKEDEIGRDIRLSNGNFSSRILPIKIHDLDTEDQNAIETEIGGILRAIEFIYKEPGVNRPLNPTDDRSLNLEKTDYKNQINKVANALKEIVAAIRNPNPEKHSNITQQQSTKPPKAIKKNTILGAILILLLCIAGYFYYPKIFTKTAAENIEKSIAVLPFKNIGSDSAAQIFSDGLADGILDHLTRTDGFAKIISRTSTEKYRETTLSVPEISSELNVSYLLEGSIQKYENTVRITVQLITSDDKHVWSEVYDRELTDLFKIQSEIAKKVVNTLSIRLNDQEMELFEATPTINAEAYKLSLRGDKYAELFDRRRDTLDMEIAIDFYRKALEIDPDFEDVLTSIGWLYETKATRVYWFQMNRLDLRNKLFDSALRISDKIIAINPNNPIAYELAGNIYYWQQYDQQNDSIFKKMVFAFNKVNQLRPGSDTHLFNQALIYMLKKRPDSVLYFLKKRVAVNPNGLAGYWNIASRYRNFGLLETAKAYLAKPLKEEPDNVLWIERIAQLHYFGGDYDQYLEANKRLFQLNETENHLYDLICAYILTGNFEEAEKYVLGGLKKIEDESYIVTAGTRQFHMLYGYLLWQKGEKEAAMNHFQQEIKLAERFEHHGILARIYSFLNEKEKAIQYVKLMFEQDDTGLPDYYWFVLNDFMYANIRDDERVKEMIKKEMNEMNKYRANFELMEVNDELKRGNKR